MSSNEEPVVDPAPVEVDENEPPATPVESSVLSGGEELAKSSPEVSRETPTASPGKASRGTSVTAKRPVSGTATRRPTSSSASKPITGTTRTASTLNKPPTRPSTTTSTRKPLSTSTTSSHRSRMSVSSSADEKPRSVASSGDEKRGISGTAKRMSMAGTASTRAPLRPTSSSLDRRSSVAGPTAERRTATTTARTSTSTSKPVGRLTSSTTPASRTATTSTTRPATARPTSTTSTVRSTTATDPKRRSSVVPGAITRTGDSEKLQALQTKLTESEEIVASLKTELEIVNEKLGQLSVSAEEPSGDVSAIETIRAGHTAEIEKLTSVHAEELQALQARLDDAESRRKELEESSQKELEEARQSASAQGDDKTVALLDELKLSHQTQLEAIEKELAEHKSAASHFEEQIAALRNELEFQKTALEEEKAQNLDHFNRELKGRDQVMENLNTEIMKLNTLKEQEVRAAEESAQQSLSTLQEQISSLEAKLAAAESATKKSPEQTTSIAEKDQEIADLKQALEKIQRELEQAREIAATELTSKVGELDSDHEAAIANLKAEHDAAISEISSSHAEKLAVATAAVESSGTEHSKELQELRDALETSKATAQKGQDDAIAELKAAHEAELKSLQERLEASEAAAQNGQDDAVAELKAAHEAELKSLQERLEASEATAQNRQQEAIAELKAAHEAELNSLQEKLEASEAGAQKGKEDAMAELKAAHETEVKSLQEQLETSENALTESRRALDQGNASAQDLAVQEIDALRHKCESLESQLATGTGKINALLEEMQSKQAEAEAIHRILREVEDHSKEEGVEKDNKLKALEEKAAEATILLEQHTSQAASAAEQHAQALEDLKAQHAAQLASELERAKEASGSHDTALGELQSKHDELLAFNKELESSHATRVQGLEAELKAVLENHAGEIATQTETRENEITELQKQFEETQAKLQAELAALQSSSKADAELHEKQAAALQADFEETKAQLQTEIEAAKISNAANIDAEHSKTIADLQQGFEQTKAQLRAEIEAVQSSKAAENDAEHGKAIEQLLTMHESKISALREELEASNKSKIDDLQKAHDAALACVNDQLSQAKAAAEDTSALDSLNAAIADLQAKLADSEKAYIAAQESAASVSKDIEDRHSSELVKIQADNAALGEKYQAVVAQVGELEKAALDSEGQKSHLESIMKQLSESRDQLLKVKADNAAISDSLVDCKNQNKTLSEKLEAGERDLNDQIDKNMSLLNQLGDVDSEISASRRRVRELETELAVLKADTGAKSSSSGLEASRWATADEGSENAEDGGPATTEGEDLGPCIEGTMASIQEQLKHIRTANDGWYSEHHRLIGELALLSRQSSPESGSSTTPKEDPASAPEPEPARARAATVSFFGKR